MVLSCYGVEGLLSQLPKTLEHRNTLRPLRLLLRSQYSKKVRFSPAPVAFDGTRRDVQHGGGLGVGEPAEEAAFDDLHEAFVECAELRQGRER